MNEHQKRDLVDRYLLRQTTTEENQMIHDLRQTDPVFDQYITESELAFQSLSIARRKKLKEKLRDLDERANKKKRGGGMMLLLVGILGILIIGSWLAFRFSPAALAVKFFHDQHEIKILNTRDQEIWLKGKQAFQEEQFDSSLFYFSSISSTTNDASQTEARWNFLLSQLALHGPTSQWQEDVLRFSALAPTAFKKDASALLAITRTQLYQFVYMGKWKNAMKVVKPKII